ncbi:MAG: hypothetical protein WC389_11545 [Lutibacter sp.]|jgi:hypothetical protein
MAQFKKGSEKKGGRKAGIKNRTTEQFRELIKNFVENNWDRLQKDFEQAKPNERLQFINSMLRHFLPDPVNPEKLTELQLIQVLEYLKNKENEKNN